MIDLSRATRKPFSHQIVGVERLCAMAEPNLRRIYPGCLLLADEMRLGKTYQVVNAAQALFLAGEIKKVVVVAPASVRDTWFDQTLGEINKYHWAGLPTLVTEYHQQVRKWALDAEEGQPYLTWIITNYEYLRYKMTRRRVGWRGPNLDPLLEQVGTTTWLVLDESSAVTEWTAMQTRACYALREKCSRITLLNGTPDGEGPEDLYAQARMMDYRILNLDTAAAFRAKYAIMGGYEREVWNPKAGHKTMTPVEVVGWRHKQREGCCDIPPWIKTQVHDDGPNLEDIQVRMAPYVLRRMRVDCYDLPPKLDPVAISVVLKPETWRLYKEMEKELVTWLTQHMVATAQQAGVKVMRLHQLTTGFLGGVLDELAVCGECDGTGDGQADPSDELGALNSALNLESPVCPACGGEGTLTRLLPPVEVGREKLDAYLEWVEKRMAAEKDLRMITWCKFRAELDRLVKELRQIKGLRVEAMHGGQNREERAAALRLMHADSPPFSGPAVLAGTIGTGGKGINMAGAHEMVFCSNDRSLLNRMQSEDRPQGPGQTQSVSYHDFLATGPKGQKTIDHVIAAALRSKKNLSDWTCSAWVTALKEVV